jgi:hypothetical protein
MSHRAGLAQAHHPKDQEFEDGYTEDDEGTSNYACKICKSGVWVDNEQRHETTSWCDSCGQLQRLERVK